MSATGQGGVTVIAGRNHATLNPITLDPGSSLVFNHNTGRRAFSVIVTSGDPLSYGQILTSADNITIAQVTENQIQVSYSGGRGTINIFVSCRWEEPTPELDLVRFPGNEQENIPGDPRISIVGLL